MFIIIITGHMIVAHEKTEQNSFMANRNLILSYLYATQWASQSSHKMA